MSNLCENLEKLEEKINLRFKDKDLLKRALIHRSFLNEAKEKDLRSNERLEFLGDAILEFWVSNEIFRLFPDFPEGQMTFARTFLVRTETLAKIAKDLNLGDFLLMSKGEEAGGGRQNIALLANAFEAVLGAIFIDQGMEKTSDFLLARFDPLLKSIISVEALKDSKSQLQEIVQAQGYPSPTYRLISSSGPDHQKIFNMGVFMEDKLLAQGTSKSKQEAEEEAAKKALEKISKIR